MNRIESGMMVIKKEEFFLDNAIEQVNMMIGGQCREKWIHYECIVKGKTDDYYTGDEMKLKQVIINILGNAVKFTPTGGKVQFLVEECARNERMTTFKMIFKDTGIGMSSEFLPHIFDAFSQEDGTTTSKYGGSGLGLAITKNIVTMMKENFRK